VVRWWLDDGLTIGAFDPHGRMIVTRTSIDELDDTPRYQWDLLRHSTIVWAL